MRAAWLRDTTCLWNRIFALFTEQIRVRRQCRFGGDATCCERLVDTLLDEIISKVCDVSHGQHLASSD